MRGTRFITTDQPPFAPEAYTYHGLVDYEYAQRLMKVGQSGRIIGGNNSAVIGAGGLTLSRQNLQAAINAIPGFAGGPHPRSGRSPGALGQEEHE